MAAVCGPLRRADRFGVALRGSCGVRDAFGRLVGSWAAAPRRGAATDAERRMDAPRLRSARVAMRKRLGQHLLKYPETSMKIVELADVKEGDHVLEIGPGTGNLTIPLLRSGARVTAFELDERMFKTVTMRATELGLDDRFECRRMDVLRADLPAFDKVVANIPFQISSPLIRKLLTHRPHFQHAIIMFQKEFADRLYAKPGTKAYSRLSVNTQLHCHAEEVMLIKRQLFRPPPKVDSSVVRITPKDVPADLDQVEWEHFLRLCFHAKNKMLRAVFQLRSISDAISHFNDGDPTAVERAANVIRRLNLDTRRPHSLHVDEFLLLFRALKVEGLLLTDHSELASA